MPEARLEPRVESSDPIPLHDHPPSSPLPAYIEYQRRRNFSDSTRRRRDWSLTSLAMHSGSDLLGCTAEDIEAWLDARPISPQTRATNLADVRAFYAWAARRGLVDTDPTVDIPRPRLPRPVPRPISDEQLALALASADQRMAAMLALAAYAGLRVNEIARLRGEHVDVPRGVLLVAHGKGGHQRLLPLRDQVLRRLRAHGLPSEGWVFPGYRTCHLSPATVSHYIGRHLRACGIEATAHQGRHWFATTAYRLSGDLRLVQDLMGHASPVTTARYSAWAPELAAAVLDRFPS